MKHGTGHPPARPRVVGLGEGGEGMTDDRVDITDLYAAEREACRLEALVEEAENTLRRLRNEYLAAVRKVRELVRRAGEEGREGPTLFDTLEG